MRDGQVSLRFSGTTITPNTARRDHRVFSIDSG
jgi:hypothetical protein